MFRRHYKFLCMVAFAIVKNEDAAEDIVQDFFLHLWRRRTEIPPLQSFQAYATRAVKNLSISHLRKAQPLADEHLHTLADETDSPELKEILVSEETITARVMEVIELLPTERKKIFLLHVVHRLSYSQIAEKNNISLNTVKTQMKKAYAFIRARVADDTLSLILLTILLKQV